MVTRRKQKSSRQSHHRDSNGDSIVTVGANHTAVGTRWTDFLAQPKNRILLVAIFALVGAVIVFISHANPAVSIQGYSLTNYHTTRQTIGSTAWTGAWNNPDGTVGVSFFEANGPIPATKSLDYSATTQTHVYLKAPAGSSTFTEYQRDPVKTPSGKAPYYSTASTAQPDITLKDGSMIRRFNAEDSPEGFAGISPNYATAFIQRRAAPTAATPDPSWSAPIYLLPPAGQAGKTYNISRIQYLKDGRLLATGGSWDAAAGTRNSNSVVRLVLMVSSNGGVSWSNALTPGTQDTAPFPNEWDTAELPNGNLLAVFRSRPLSGGTTQVRNQALLEKHGTTWTITAMRSMATNRTTANPEGVPVPHSGHPELLAVKEGEGTDNRKGIVLYFATTGYLYTADAGDNWLPLTGTGVPTTNDMYYPNSVQGDDGTIYIFGHNQGTGGDAKYGAYDQKIEIAKFKLNVSGAPPVDTTPPDTTLTAGGPTGSTTATTGSFGFTATESGSTFTCKLDAAAYAACTSPKAYSGLAVGSHTFSVRATDAAGNVDATPATRTWTVTTSPPVDTTPPNTTIGTGPATSTTDTAASFTFTSSESSSTFACKLDTAAYTTCSSPKAYSGLAIGSHTFSVRATDAAGNLDATPATQTWTVSNPRPPVDTTPPDTTLTAGGPTGSTTATTGSFGFTATESGSTFTCKLDAAAYAACTSPKAYSGLAVGSHTFSVRATDAAGNVDATPATRTWTVTTSPPVDTTPPNTTISAGPSNPTMASTASFTFSASETGSTFACQLDAAAYAACTSPKAYSGLTVGSHAFHVRATDAAGNTDPTPATMAWTVTATPPPPDTIPPDTTLTASPTGYVNSASASFSFTSNEVNVSYLCQLDNTPYTPCTSPKTYTDLADGPRAFRVKATDAAGNIDPTPATRGWTIDTTAPASTITAPLHGSTVSGSLNIAASASDATAVTKVELYIDGQLAATDIAAPYVYAWNTTTYSSGSHSLTTKAYDTAGNVVTSIATSVIVSNQPPAGPNPGDTNGDGKVDIYDLSRLASNWNKTSATRAQGDLNSDTVVNIYDLSILASKWDRKEE